MEIDSLIPGVTTAGDAITLTTGIPDIDAVIAAEIERLPVAMAAHPAADIVGGVANHTGANILAAIADHPDAAVLAAIADHSAILMAAAFGNHTMAQVVAAVADHAVHAHDLEVETGASVEAFGAAGLGTAHLISASGQTIPGGVGATGIQDIAAAQAHAGGGAPIAHAAGANVGHVAGATAMPHLAGGAPVVHGAGAVVGHVGASPVVAAIPARASTRTITLDVNTLLGDVLTLYYLAVGERIATS